MIKKGMTALLIFMALSSTVAQAKIISYEVKTNGGPIKSYATDQLVDGFLAYKQGEHSEIYINFIKDLKSGKYEAFQDDTKKYVSYDLIVQAFLEAKENNKSFNVEEFVKHAKGIDLTTGGQRFTKDDIKDSDLSDEDKKKAEELWEQQHGGSHSSHSGDYHYEDIKDVVNDVTKAMDTNMPVISKKQQDEINNDFTRGRWRTDLNINTIDPMCRNDEDFRDWADGSYFKKLGIPAFVGGIPFSELKGKGERNALLDSKYFNKDEYKYLTDLDNYEKFEGLDINFDNVVNKNMYVGSIVEPYRSKSDEGIDANPKGLFREDDDGYACAMLYPQFVSKYKNPIIWRPDFERDMIKEINKLRESKDMKPLTYDVNLHAISRYSAKRNHFAFSKGQLVSKSCFSPTAELRFWPNGSIGNALQHNKQQDGKDIVKLEGNENRLFNYKGHVKAMCAMNPIFSKPKDFLDYWEYYKNPSNVMQWNHGDIDTFRPYDPTPHMEESLLNPSMTKIGVGSIWEAPANTQEMNGALGVFITVE